MACVFAHLIAIKQFVDDNTFDLILEDNVRACPDDCAARIWESIKASKEWENDNENNKLLYCSFCGKIISDEIFVNFADIVIGSVVEFPPNNVECVNRV